MQDRPVLCLAKSFSPFSVWLRCHLLREALPDLPGLGVPRPHLHITVPNPTLLLSLVTTFIYI